MTECAPVETTNVSLAYVAEATKPNYVDVAAEVIDDPDGKRHRGQSQRLPTVRDRDRR